MSDTLQPFDAPQDVREEVQREYEQTLVIPHEKPAPQWMLMPVGVIGAGKTTVVKPLAERLGLVRISTDDIRQKLKQRGYSYAGARDMAHELTKKYLSEGYSIAIDGNTGSNTGLEYNKKSAEAFPAVRQLFVHINPPDEFIINKLRSYHHTWLFKDADHAVESFYKNKEDFKLPQLTFVYTFDPSRTDMPQQIKKGIDAIKKALQGA